jgi:hypothetical protein
MSSATPYIPIGTIVQFNISDVCNNVYRYPTPNCNGGPVSADGYAPISVMLLDPKRGRRRVHNRPQESFRFNAAHANSHGKRLQLLVNLRPY